MRKLLIGFLLAGVMVSMDALAQDDQVVSESFFMDFSDNPI
jgi:hypothetical protein